VEYDQTSISRKSAEQIVGAFSTSSLPSLSSFDFQAYFLIFFYLLSLVEWTLSIDWELKLDKDLSHAATKIQGQARRRRDARRVKKLKEGNSASCAHKRSPCRTYLRIVCCRVEVEGEFRMKRSFLIVYELQQRLRIQ